MELIIKETILKFKYDTLEERNKHVEEMKKQGFEDGGRIRRTDDSIWCDNPIYYYYSELYKRESGYFYDGL